MTVKANEITALGENILVHNMYFGEQKTKSGIVVLNDDGKDSGIYPRWAQVYAIGPQNKDDIEVGQWVLIDHGRWTRSIEVETDNGSVLSLRKIDREAILVCSDEKPDDVFVAETLDIPSAVEAYRV